MNWDLFEPACLTAPHARSEEEDPEIDPSDEFEDEEEWEDDDDDDLEEED